MASRSTILLLAGAGVIALAATRRRKKIRREHPTEDAAPNSDVNLDDEDDPTDESHDDFEPAEAPSPSTRAALLARHMDPEGRAQLGMLYQIRPGDTPLGVCCEALFGSRKPPVTPGAYQACKELLIRMDCGPWNQANYAVPIEELKDDHESIGAYFTQKGVSFHPIYQDNLQRILDGEQPSAEPGHSYALAWIPMINPVRFDDDMTVTTEGMFHPDTDDGRGGSMIDPPQEILDLGFAAVSGEEVGCDLPEGDFRRQVIAS